MTVPSDAIDAVASSAWTWEEMLAAFRALGGVADNVRRAKGPRGFGLFAIDPAAPVTIFVPPRLLIPVAHVAFRDGALVVKADAPVGAREADFFNRYQAGFSCGAGGLAKCLAHVAALDALPPAVRAIIAGEFMTGALFSGSAMARAEHLFLRSRWIRWQGAPAIMPMMELLNHAPGGQDYGRDQGLIVRGHFTDEVLACYSRADPFDMFAHWGFASAEPLAFSLPMLMPASKRTLIVGRSLRPMRPGSIGLRSTRDGNVIELPRLQLGDMHQPELPKRIFSRALAGVEGINGDRLFDEIAAVNRARFVKLAEAVAGLQGALAETLRNTCAWQLAALPA